MKFILGTKEKMTQIFAEDGAVVPVTVVSVPESTVVSVKTAETDGYSAVQIGSGVKKEKNIKKPEKGHFKNLGNFRYLKEFRVPDPAAFKVGDKIGISAFGEADVLRVSGVSKGKGFQGVVKRHGFGGGRRSHGQKHSEREPGSIGGAGRAGGRVVKGMRMAGRMGNDRVTEKNVKVALIDKENGLLFLKGALPGRRGTLLEIISA